MNTGALSLTFSETVVASTFSVSGLSLFASPFATPVSLSSLSHVDIGDSSVLTLRLSDSDLNRLKALDNLLRNQSSSFIQLAADSVRDVFNNVLSAMTSPMGASAFVSDATPPTLVSFDLDAGSMVVLDYVAWPTMTLTLRFSETVRISTLKPTRVTLQSSAVAISQTQSFALGSLALVGATADSTILTYKLNVSDANSVKLLSRLAKSANGTFISLATGLVDDMAGNSMVPISPSLALAVQVFVPDTAPPRLARFSMDVNRGACSLTFDEPVLGASLEPPQMTLQDSVRNPTRTLRLSGGLGASSLAWVATANRTGFMADNNTVVVVSLTLTDLNSLKAAHFCRGADDCFLVHTGLLVRDVVGNAIQPCV